MDMVMKPNELIEKANRIASSNKRRAGTAVVVQGRALGTLYYGAAAPAGAQKAVCETPVGDFTSGLITAALGVGVALVLLGLVVSFGGRPLAFSRNIMGKLSAMSSNSIIGLIGIVFVAVIFSWILAYAPINIPQGCVPIVVGV